MCRNIGQRNNLVLLLASVLLLLLLLLFKRMSIRTYLRRSVCLVSMLKRTYLLIELTSLPWRHSGKQFGVADWTEGWTVDDGRIRYSKYCATCCSTANVLRFADHWWISRVSEAWKEVRLSEEILDISKSILFLPMWSYIGPELLTGYMALSCDWCSYQLKTFEHLLKTILVAWSWAMLEAQD